MNGIVAGASTFLDISHNQRTTLTETDGVFYFSPPEAGSSDYIEIVNGTTAVQDAAIGFKDGRSPLPIPVIYLDDISANSLANSQFTPILRVYVTTTKEFKETFILKSPIVGEAIWERDLATLDQATFWTLSKDLHGHFKIAQAPWGGNDSPELPESE